MPRIRKAWKVKIDGLDNLICEYAPTRSKARAICISRMVEYNGVIWQSALESIESCTRWPGRDVILPGRHPLAEALDPKILHCIAHAYGGTGYEAGYRDHYYTGAEYWPMCAGLYHGLFEISHIDKARSGSPEMRSYILTDLGRNVAAGEVQTYPRR